MTAPRAPGANLSLSQERANALASAVKAARAEAGITQEQLVRRTGLNLTHIQRIERGVANPTLATTYALADAFGMTLTDFFGYEAHADDEAANGK